MWAIEASSGLKSAYRGGWYHFASGYTTQQTEHDAVVAQLRLQLLHESG